MAGPITGTSLYSIKNDEWIASIDLPSELAGHCAFSVQPNKVVLAGGYKENNVFSLKSISIDVNKGGLSKVVIDIIKNHSSCAYEFHPFRVTLKKEGH